jgi:uncharacterized membrane protein
LVFLPAVWLLWPLLFVVVLVAGLAMGLAEVVQVFRRAFPKEKR